jgi:methylisocitrate lyase
MTSISSLRDALSAERPLQVVGVINAYSALLARRAGFRALYLSGAGVANADLGVPDLAITTLHDVATQADRITSAVDLPLLVDADTGFGSAFNIARTVRVLARAGAAGLHLEDQVTAKRCGHRPGKRLVPAREMTDRLKAALDARDESSFVIMARTDAAAVEGLDAAIERACLYAETGADMIFAEALPDETAFARFTAAVPVPVLANMTEFGRTPLLDLARLDQLGVALVLYPLTAFRAMSAAAREVYEVLRRDGHQRALLGKMQTREELYEVLDYHAYEQRLDALFGTADNDPPHDEAMR